MMAACDCGVFPTKAEGWGLPILESMALGQPTIVTNYSGVTEYANSDNAILLDYHTIPIDGLFFQRQDKDYGTWALVNTQTLRQKMREVYQNHQYYRAKSLAAAVDIKENWSWLASANKAWEFISKILAGEKVTNLKNDYRQSLEKQVKAATEFRDSLGLYTQAIIANTRQGSFAVDPEDSIIGKALRHHGGCWEHELKMLQSFFNDRSKVLVLGSHIGILTIPIAKECQEVVAFEANPKTYQLLKLNLMLNNIDNCRAFNLAASNKFEKLEFVLSRVNSGGSKRSPLVDRIEYFYDSPQTVMVDAVPVDSYIADRDFDLIIMDIEGSEYFALQGMQQILAQAKVLQIEFIPGHLQNVAGVGVEDFIAQIKPHFRSLIVPSQDLIVEQEKFTVVLEDMFDRGLSDAGIIFLKADRSQIHRSREQ
jgi:FkbM family methyltransferase